MKRFFGQETEYAILFQGKPGPYPKPGNQIIFQHFKRAINEIVKTKAGERKFYQDQFFVQNGGAFNYEFLPDAYDGGLLEGSTPECQSPWELITYQSAQEEILLKAIKLVNESLESESYSGKVSLIKNCKDAKDNIYGAQENYECVLAKGPGLFFYRFFLILNLGIFSLFQLVYLLFIGSFYFTLFAILFALLLPFGIGYLVLRFFSLFPFFKKIKNWVKSLAGFGKKMEQRVGNTLSSEKFLVSAVRFEYGLLLPVHFILYTPVIILLKILAFRKYRKTLIPFLSSRPIITGAGTLSQDGAWAFSEKITALKRITRSIFLMNDRVVFDFGNIIKMLVMESRNILLFRFHSLKSLFRQRQRLQLGISDSNRSQVSEYLKFGMTLLVLEMTEKEFLKDFPKIKGGISTIRKINTTENFLKKTIPTSMGILSAWDIQKFFCNRAREFIKTEKSIALEMATIVDIWEETLKSLKHEPERLIGKLDWATKKFLLDNQDQESSFQSLKKIDIKYHLLGNGYFDSLAGTGLIQKLISSKAAREAMKKPPGNFKAKMRSKIILDPEFDRVAVTLSWNSAAIGGLFSKKIINLDQARKKKKNEDIFRNL